MAKKHVKVLTSKDGVMLKSFRDVGYLKENHLKDIIGVTDRRINSFIKDGYIEKVGYMTTTKEGDTAYRLTNKGKRLCENQLNLNNFYKSSSVSHDIALANQYFSISQEQRDTWHTERDIRSSYEPSDNMSPPDGCYKDGDRFIAIEIVTSSYSSNDIAGKINFCNTYDLEYNQVRI